MPKKIRPTIGARIRAARGERTRAEVARAVGVDYATFWRWERDKQEPAGPSLRKLCAELGITVDSLYEDVA